AFNYYNNYITSIEFRECDFKNVFTFDDLNDFIQLRSLSFIDCEWINFQFFQPLLNTPSLLKLKSLKLIGQLTEYELLIKKFGSYLEYLVLGLNGGISGEAYKKLIIHCNQIKFLQLMHISYDDYSQLYRMITSNKEHLKYLSVSVSMCMGAKFLCELALILPNSLEYLNLQVMVDNESLKKFLINVRHVELNSLLYRNLMIENIDLVFSILKDFVIQNEIRRFAYSIDKYFNRDNLNI
ncbi:17668_t:CDS:1, partial [Funneliformis geosporum]